MQNPYSSGTPYHDRVAWDDIQKHQGFEAQISED
jgi:hypothetical protein